KIIFRWKSKIVFRNANKVSDFVSPGPKKLFNRLLVNRVDHVISVSELCRLDFVKTYGCDVSKTTTVTIGIQANARQYNLPADLSRTFQSGKVLLHVASFVPEKNHEGLLRIAQMLTARKVDFKLLLVGEGKLRANMEQQVPERGLSDCVYFAGYRNDIPDLMARASAVVLPSLIEGLPGVILEAMYCKTPVIAYDVGGISEVVKNGETGWLIGKGDEEKFVDAIINVLQSNVEKIKSNAYQMVIQYYDNRVVAGKFEKVYECLAKSAVY
ncbi:MAG: glycosyltransferase family 4 protein, partial [Cyclobacteriaceae bacterium]|nr:glycosyltransferase family 4 protein [Cyclobacteriaceae bacterium]